jgi:hypothetical protein
MSGSSSTEAGPRRFCRPRFIAGLALAGLILVLFGAWNAAGQPLWSPGYPYDHALDRAISARVGELVAIAAACLGGVLLVVAAALFGFWLARWSHQRHRAAH